MVSDAARDEAAPDRRPRPSDESGRGLDGAEAAAGPAARPAGAADGIRDWLLTEGVRLTMTALVDGIGWRLRAAGMPLDRFTCSVRLLSASVLAASIVWRPFEPMAFRRLDFEHRNRGDWDRSPFKVAHERGTWLDLDLSATPLEAFDIVPELKAQGLLGYLVVPTVFSDGSRNSLTFATRSATGFVDADRALLVTILPALSAALEIKTRERTLNELLATYVGEGPAAKIVSGTTHRGEVTRIEAAISVADLRGFTYLSTRMPPEATANFLNVYYDVVVPPIRERGGEVLKFIGDAVLAIFPVAEGGREAACRKALAAAQAALASPHDPVEFDGSAHAIRFGIALHVGEVVYGNVGSGDRLDFTVVGRDVNVAARISSLCSDLGRPFLVSRPFADGVSSPGFAFETAGSHRVRGLEEPLEVLVPRFGPLGGAGAERDGVSVGPTLL